MIQTSDQPPGTIRRYPVPPQRIALDGKTGPVVFDIKQLTQAEMDDLQASLLKPGHIVHLRRPDAVTFLPPRMAPMRKVMLESPFAGRGDNEEQRHADMLDNHKYARACARDSFKRGEMPHASHLYFPLFLDENDPVERQTGIEFGYEWWDECEAVVFYCDKGFSPGMVAALNRAIKRDKRIEFRRLTTDKEAIGARDAVLHNELVEEVKAAARESTPGYAGPSGE